MSTLYSIRPALAGSAGFARIEKLPILLLNIHTQCNCHCLMCDIWKRKDGRALNAAALLQHRENMLSLGVEQVVLTGGEPLLNRDFEAICALFKDLRIRVTLLTSGLLLHKYACVVANYVDNVIVSIDGPAEVHNFIRQVPGAFSQIRRGVESVRLQKPGMSISCRTTVQKFNHVHLCETVDTAKSLDLASISFLPADLSSAAFNREQAWNEERQDGIGLTRDQTDRLEEEIERLIARYAKEIDQRFIVESRPKLRHIASRFRERIDGTQPLAPQCNAPWRSAVIEVDGSVRPCFFHPPVSNFFKISLTDAINSPSALAFRDTLDVATNPICQRCVCSLNYRERSSSQVT